MTTCVIVRKGNEAVLATDGQVTLGTSILDKETTKVVDCDVNGQAYVATAGSYAAITWMRTYLTRWADLVAQVRAGGHIPKYALELKKFDGDAVDFIIDFPDEYKSFIDSVDEIDPDGERGIQFAHLLMSSRGAYMMEQNYSIAPVSKFMAIGSGAQQALFFLEDHYDTSADLADIAERAIKAASKTDIGTSGKVSIYRISDIDEERAEGFLKVRVSDADVDFYRARVEEEEDADSEE